MATDDDDEIVIPKKAKSRPASSLRTGSGSGKPSPQMRRLMRITRGIGIALGGFVSLVGMMALVGLVTDNFLIRLLAGLVLIVVLPALLADRLLKRTNLGGGLGMVADIFAILLLGLALFLIGADSVTRGLFTREGDRYARSGSTGMARVAYFFAGVSPVFPADKPAGKGGVGSASASASASTGAR